MFEEYESCLKLVRGWTEDVKEDVEDDIGSGDKPSMSEMTPNEQKRERYRDWLEETTGKKIERFGDWEQDEDDI